ncbi:hypothetical protein QM012_005486 [Aureobasidium pullulans]|uniref:Nucleotide-diphospho-sugar transferase n=1 Tax=Aureobasidium pullulans TaxID=5580 RepID=A0ABR0T5Y6_AURPU
MTTRSTSYRPIPRWSSDLEESDFDLDHTAEASTLARPSRFPAWFRTRRSVTLWPYHQRRHINLRWLLVAPIAFLCIIIISIPLLNPSYTYKPKSYTGKNPLNERVFIVAAIVDAELIRGAWGEAVLELIAAVGNENAFVSIYNNDSGPETSMALSDKAVVSEHLPLEGLIQPELSQSQEKVRRIPYLAEVRNRAMRPFYTSERYFDKVLFLNDVVFSGRDAADLLFATGTREPASRTTYHAACAVDFINPFKFYDTFATRDSNGYGMGLPFFPWFSGKDGGHSRKQVMKESDAVPVRSCWGGMVAFEARWFEPGASDEFKEDMQSPSSPVDLSASVRLMSEADGPVRFRGEEELFREASECCLIHADIDARARLLNISKSSDSDLETIAGSNIVMNPFIRVAYTRSSFRWLGLTRRFERLYALPHLWASWLVGLPFGNLRQFQEAGENVDNLVWRMRDQSKDSLTGTGIHETSVTDAYDGCYQMVSQKARPGGFCGVRQLSVLKAERRPGEKMWKSLPAPPLNSLCGSQQP